MHVSPLENKVSDDYKIMRKDFACMLMEKWIKKVAYPFTTQTEALHRHKEPTWDVSHRE